MSADRAQPGGSTAPLLACEGLSKHYGGVVAVDRFDIEVGRGEIVALVGDNGAGKSTVIKMLSGAVLPDAGTTSVRGEPVVLRSPKHAQRLGIETVWQNLAIAPDMDPSANLFLGRELVHGRRLRLLAPLRTKQMRRRTEKHLAGFGIELGTNVAGTAGQLSGGQAQALAIARAATWAKDLLLLDEPTAALGVKQSGIVVELCRTLRSRGMSIVLISHDLPQVLAMADRVVVLRHGRKVFDGPDIDHESLVRRIVGID